ncbi:SDR family NAD(P)-dependent oxidoreductase [Yinghuangia soli]|uniref:SDR family oxidoreductase n=1 Tax=Yinghuangia soli TaxID=2908204 RepID=A0AA41PUV7_9ACTN|nr:SDR family oxidoreductase [Yinghuangia soli]MCF2526285.1 SDR family oxidoreductase [Yinghuangia soli]
MVLDASSSLLTGKVAVVTGAARGIGAATAVALARFGADVAICDKEDQSTTLKALEETGRKVYAGTLDVRDTEAVEAFVQGAHAELGALDVLVNNAGGGFWAPFLEVSPKGQRALIDENFTTVANVVRSGVPLMNDGGSIVNVTSVEAHRAAPGFAVYAAMKAAVEQLTKSLALELAHRRIRVNCVAPDAIPTPGDEGLAESVGGLDYAAKVPFGLGTPDDCAAPIVFLAGPMSGFMTGTTLHVDGGTHAASGWTRRPDGVWTP